MTGTNLSADSSLAFSLGELRALERQRVDEAREAAARLAAVEEAVRAQAVIRLEAERAALEATLRRTARARRWPARLIGVVAAMTMIAAGCVWMAVRAEREVDARRQAAVAAAHAAEVARTRAEAEARERDRVAAVLAQARARAEQTRREVDARVQAIRTRVEALRPGARRPPRRPPAPPPTPIRVCTDGVLC